MRFTVLLILLMICSGNQVLGQYNKWSLDAHLGFSNATQPFAAEYSSNYLNLFHFDFGGRYMASNKVGLRLDVGFDRIKNDELGNIQGPQDSTGTAQFLKSKEFETHYFRLSLQAVFDLGRVFQFEKLHKDFSMLAHLGFGFSSLKDKKNSVWFKDWKSQGSDEMMNLMFGLTPQWRLHDDWSINLDFTIVGNAWQSKTWDFTENVFEKGIHGRLMNFSVGASYYLGKHDKHMDWVIDGGTLGGYQVGDTVRTIETIRTIERVHVPGDEGGGAGDDSAALLTDTDGDGVPDREDDCPAVPGNNKNGCPNHDTDADGIPDATDKCPNKPGIIENDGCPELDLYVKKVLNEAMIDVEFQHGNDVLEDESYPILDKVVKVMNEYPYFYLDIEGHTHNVGRPEPNMVLSKARAKRVLDYMVSKGIDASRLASDGFGDTRPIAENNDPKGREQNERIEFVVRFE